MQKYLSVSDVVRLSPVRVSPVTVRCWIDEGKLRGRKIAGRYWVSPQEFERFFGEPVRQEERTAS